MTCPQGLSGEQKKAWYRENSRRYSESYRRLHPDRVLAQEARRRGGQSTTSHLPPDTSGISEAHRVEWLPVVQGMPKFLETQATEAYKRWQADKAEQKGWTNGYVRV